MSAHSTRCTVVDVIRFRSVQGAYVCEMRSVMSAAHWNESFVCIAYTLSRVAAGLVQWLRDVVLSVWCSLTGVARGREPVLLSLLAMSPSLICGYSFCWTLCSYDCVAFGSHMCPR